MKEQKFKNQIYEHIANFKKNLEIIKKQQQEVKKNYSKTQNYNFTYLELIKKMYQEALDYSENVLNTLD